MPKLSHKNIISLVNAFATVPPGGVCHGFTAMWAFAESLDDEQSQKFYQRLSNIHDKYVVNGTIDIPRLMQDYEQVAEKGRRKEPLTEEDLNLFDIRALAEQISLQQDFFNQRTNFELGFSKMLEKDNNEKNDFVVKEVGSMIPKESYADYLEAIKAVLKEHVAKGCRKVNMLHGMGQHTVGLGYPGKDGAWKFMDINLSDKDYHSVDSNKLANFMMTHYKGKGRLFASTVSFNLTVFAKGESAELIEKLQAVSKEFAQRRYQEPVPAQSIKPNPTEALNQEEDKPKANHSLK